MQQQVIQLRTAVPMPYPEAYAPAQVMALTPRCAHCSLRPLCLAAGLDDDDLPQLGSVIGQWRMVHRGDYLFRVGHRFQCLYTLRSGSFKTVAGHEEGVEHVTAYLLPGDMLGLGAISGEHYDCDAIALEDSTVCVIPFSPLELLCRDMRGVQRQLHKLLSQEIVRESRQTTLLSGMPSERRVAAFLLNISRRLRARGYAAHAFTLRMTREEIGSYLGIKLETVSRTFSRFQREGLIRVDGKRIEIFDLDALTQV